ncbi:flagellar hook-basal body complex protein FliE [Treponema pedis]|uniref:Flagellar hook-basal body complex protein FliE n=1 Tax=Treponema pedis str. T A4 TaxID=1291379 RepID=S5ZPP9_9SPIR|nr:flagellar hook-basal body complex protein FliE [Treponema pedis]AGT44582.1 flagellar hook-basal body protein FliE [Treponema pedis str. T A4]QSI05257.1 flagellar hook-basal body complex protein FliE [Treponema pedis]
MINQVNAAHVYKVPGLLEVPQVGSVITDNFRSRMVSDTDMIELAVNKPAASFEQLILKAFDDVNSKQIKMNELSEQMIIDPDSVDVHDITIGMAQANLSLKLAQTVIDRLVKSWNDITTTR